RFSLRSARGAAILNRPAARRYRGGPSLTRPRFVRHYLDLGVTMRRFVERGEVARLSRREFAGRAAALLTARAALPFYNESALAQDLKAIAAIPADAVRLNANENPMGPCPAAIEAIRAIVPQGGRYLFNESRAFAVAMAASEGLHEDYVVAAAGSS